MTPGTTLREGEREGYMDGWLMDECKGIWGKKKTYEHMTRHKKIAQHPT